MSHLATPVQLGKRRQYLVSVLSARGSYPTGRFEAPNALFVATPSLVYTVVPAEEPNEHGFSEIAWADVGEIRLWGAMMFSLVEGQGFYCFYPYQNQRLLSGELNPRLSQQVAERLASKHRRQKHRSYRDAAEGKDTLRLYEALLRSDNVLLRGVSCYLKSHLLWNLDRTNSVLLYEEMAFNLYIALEAGLSVLRRRLSEQAHKPVSFDEVFRFVAATFLHGGGLAEYWKDCHDDRNMLLHPDSVFGAYVMHPMIADDIYELLDPMQSLYRYLLLGELRPAVR